MPPVILFGLFNAFGAKSPDSDNYLFSKLLFQKRTIFTLLLRLLGEKTSEADSKVNKKIAVGDVRQLLGTIQVESKDASELMKMAGCACKRGASSTVSISLAVPVHFPTISRGRGK